MFYLLLLHQIYMQNQPQIDQAKYRTAMDYKDAAQRVTEIRDDVITFALQQLSTENHRYDYKELLELTVIFLGGIPPKGINFRYPGASLRFAKVNQSPLRR